MLDKGDLATALFKSVEASDRRSASNMEMERSGSNPPLLGGSFDASDAEHAEVRRPAPARSRTPSEHAIVPKDQRTRGIADGGRNFASQGQARTASYPEDYKVKSSYITHIFSSFAYFLHLSEGF